MGCIKMMDGRMRVIGVMDGGMDLEMLPLPMVIRMKVNIDLINVMDVDCTNGMMDVNTMVSSMKISVMARVPLNGQMVPFMKVTLCMDNGKVRDGIPFRMVDVMKGIG